MGSFDDLRRGGRAGELLAPRTGRPLAARRLGQTPSPVDSMLGAVAAQQATAQRLMSSGVIGEATITGTRETGVTVNENPEVELDLRVTLPGSEPYAVSHRQVLSRLVMGNFAAGTLVPVRVDPEDRQKLMIA